MTAAPYDPEALWLKAKLFLNLAMDHDEVRTFDERALWASLALELLAKSALARVSPLLVAEPTDDGTNLLIASGLVEGQARFTSARAKTVFSRCARSFKPFSERESMLIANARNEYLHGTSARFAPIPENAWWPKYWAQAAVLVAAQDLEIADLVGKSRAPIVEAHLVQNTKNVENRVGLLVERARQRLAQYEAGKLPARIQERWHVGDLTVGLDRSESETCPACANQGTIEGGEVIDAEVTYERISEDEFDPFVTLAVASDYFSCSTCHLVLDGLDLIERAGLRDVFNAEGCWEDVVPHDGRNG